MVNPFNIARIPPILFRIGAIDNLPAIAAGYGSRLLLVTGARSFEASGKAERLLHELAARRVEILQVTVDRKSVV